MPRGAKAAIHARIAALKSTGATVYAIAEKLQDIWPGCTSNHVRGVVAGRQSALTDGKTLRPEQQKRRMAIGKPWRPGDPKPGGAR